MSGSPPRARGAGAPPVSRFLRHISPLGEVKRIRSPVLIVQGTAGAGSRAAQSRQLAYLLRFHRDSVWLLTASDAGNGFSPPADRAAFFATAAQFLMRLAKK